MGCQKTAQFESPMIERNNANKKVDFIEFISYICGFSFTSVLRVGKDHLMVRLLIRLWRESPQIRRWCLQQSNKMLTKLQFMNDILYEIYFCRELAQKLVNEHWALTRHVMNDFFLPFSYLTSKNNEDCQWHSFYWHLLKGQC